MASRWRSVAALVACCGTARRGIGRSCLRDCEKKFRLDQINASMSQASFLEVTGQATKFFVGVCLFVVIGMCLTWMFLSAELTDYFPFMILSTVVAALAVGVWLCLAIRCPRCRARIVWVAIHERGVGDWLFWLLALQTCPRCAFDPGSTLLLQRHRT